MSERCRRLHRWLSRLPLYGYPLAKEKIPPNGIYVLYEKGEEGHGECRVVRVGTHTGEGQLYQRLKHHYISGNKDRNIFRKNIGRCFLRKRNDPYLSVWDIAFRSKRAFAEKGHLIDREYQETLEAEISRYIQQHIFFRAIPCEGKNERLRWESRLISTVSLCSECAPSERWLGRYSPKEKIRKSGLWQVNELYKQPLSDAEFRMLADRISKVCG